MSAIADVSLRPFVSGSFSQILEQRQQEPFVLVLWSLDCPSCYKELEMLGKLLEHENELNIVLVSTDISATDNEVQTVLSKYKLDNIESWVFRGESDESLRYEIDHLWYGELPRSYFFTSIDKKQVISGVLSEKKLMEWLKP
ncbi:MAG: hypothetical protein OQK95_03040 [Gammaproteobacteria bacterium]|nr:hypothetical protein [Gammaproteobacteria bacterium]MCW9031143.1 hypothetical protein [Gammaproteobacteria bacterium]